MIIISGHKYTQVGIKELKNYLLYPIQCGQYYYHLNWSSSEYEHMARA